MITNRETTDFELDVQQANAEAGRDAAREALAIGDRVAFFNDARQYVTVAIEAINAEGDYVVTCDGQKLALPFGELDVIYCESAAREERAGWSR